MSELSKNQLVLKGRDILDRLPHRYPFLMVDKVLELSIEEKYIIAQKNVTFNEGQFQGHFPNFPLFPGVLIIEAMAQTGALWVNYSTSRNDLAALLSVDNAKFRRPIVPGDVVTIRVDIEHLSSKGGKSKCQAFVDGQKAAEANISFVFMKKEEMEKSTGRNPT